MDRKRLEFIKSGPFHDMVTAYMAALSGLIMFAPSFRVDLEQLKPVGLASRVLGALSFPPNEVKARFLRGDFELSTLVNPLMFVLANGAYERAQQAYSKNDWLRLREKHPEIEFLRHLRHVASHRNGIWSFKNGEPKRRAAWRDKVVDKNLEGRAIWDVGIAEGDILYLLWDVEQILLQNPPQGGW